LIWVPGFQEREPTASFEFPETPNAKPYAASRFPEIRNAEPHTGYGFPETRNAKPHAGYGFLGTETEVDTPCNSNEYSIIVVYTKISKIHGVPAEKRINNSECFLVSL
jgi:hypothetical protein